MGSASLSGSLSARRTAEGRCVSAHRYRNALIDIPQVLINKRTHTFADFLRVRFVACFNGVGSSFGASLEEDALLCCTLNSSIEYLLYLARLQRQASRLQQLTSAALSEVEFWRCSGVFPPGRASEKHANIRTRVLPCLGGTGRRPCC